MKPITNGVKMLLGRRRHRRRPGDTDPSKVHDINHQRDRYRVEGFNLTVFR